MDLKAHIRAIPDFPKPGILFRDITPLLSHHGALGAVIDQLAARYRDHALDAVVGIESRGFIFAAPLALRLGCAFVPVRKAGKLPAATLKRSYQLEYGEAEIEIHADALRAGQKVVLLDDLLATGGTAQAAAELVEETGAVVAELAFVIELDVLAGRQRLDAWPVHSLVHYGDGDL